MHALTGSRLIRGIAIPEGDIFGASNSIGRNRPRSRGRIETFDHGVRDIVENQGVAQVGLGGLEFDVMEFESLHVAAEETISG